MLKYLPKKFMIGLSEGPSSIIMAAQQLKKVYAAIRNNEAIKTFLLKLLKTFIPAKIKNIVVKYTTALFAKKIQSNESLALFNSQPRILETICTPALIINDTK